MAMSEEERKAKNKARGKAWHIANKERLVAVRKAYWAANKERIATKRKAQREANKEHFAAIQKKWRDANKEHFAAIEKAWRDANKERVDFLKIRFELKSTHNITNPPEDLINLIIANRKLKRAIREVSK